jgi:hypothetical protein
MNRAIWTPDEVAYVRTTHQALTAAEQAAALARSYRSVVTKRHRLGLDPHARAYHPPIREQQLLEAEDMIAGGMHTEHALRRVGGASSSGLRHVLLRRRGGVRAIRSRQLGQQWSLAAFARLCGVEESTTWLWWRAGVLKTASRGRRQQVRIVTEEQARAFFADRATWPRWEPCRIADPDWRAFAQELRDTAGGRWLNAAQIAAQLGYAAGTVRFWLRDGRLPVGVRIGRAMYVWSTALDGFTPPVVGGRRAVQR